MKKQGFTIVESLISMLIISVIGIGITFILSSYYRATYSRDMQIRETITAIDTLEQLKSGVRSLKDLYEFTQIHTDLKMVAVGIGEVALIKDASGKIHVAKNGLDESYVFNDKLKSKKPDIFRITVFGNQPNTDITTIINIRE